MKNHLVVIYNKNIERYLHPVIYNIIYVKRFVEGLFRCNNSFIIIYVKRFVEGLFRCINSFIIIYVKRFVDGLFRCINSFQYFVFVFKRKTLTLYSIWKTDFNFSEEPDSKFFTNSKKGTPKSSDKVIKIFLEALNRGLDFASSLNSFHSMILYIKKLFPYISFVIKVLFSFLLPRLKLTSLHVGICSDKCKEQAHY